CSSDVGVDLLKFDSGLLEEIPERDHRVCLGDSPELVRAGWPGGRNALADVLQHMLRGHRVQLHMAAARQEGEALLNGALDLLTAAAQQSGIAPMHPELLAMLPHEVQHRADSLVRRATQATPQLLQEDRRAVCRAQEQQGVDRRDVDAFVEEVHGEHDANLACGKRTQRLFPVLSWCLCGDRYSREVCLV